MASIENKIYRARENLRVLYKKYNALIDKYKTEFYNINMEIDKYLETLEKQGK